MVDAQHVGRPTALGFSFGNRFTWQVRLPWKKRPLSLAYGLCGGMCFAALDLWHAGLAAPSTTEPPSWGNPFHRYLLRRQWDSWHGLAVPLRTLWWMMLPERGIARRTLAELPRILADLERGCPQVLLLLRARGIALIMNHQVVVTAYERQGALVCLRVYDPNHPEGSVSLWVDTGGQTSPVARQSTGEPLRGFFRIEYKPQTKGLITLFHHERV